MKRFFKTILILTLILSGCSSNYIKEGEEIGKNITDMITTGKLDSLPAIIKSYNTLEDSLNLHDSIGIFHVNEGIIKATADKNDTIKFCARIIMNSPEGFGAWIAEENVKNLINANRSEWQSLLSELNIIEFLYNKTGEPSSINEFQTAFNAHIDSLPPNKKSIVYARALKPSILANGMAEEIKNAASQKNIKCLKETLNVIEGIKKEYSSNKGKLDKFNTTLNSALNVMPDSISRIINSSINEKTK